MKKLYLGPLVADRIANTGGRATGFDYLRFSLAISVILFHTIVTSQGLEAQRNIVETNFGILLQAILPLFFSLSGFLVAGSLERSKSIAIFLGLRIFRIFPALAVDTIFCAILIGPIFTNLSLWDYFTHPDLVVYFQNILGIIHYSLPGVFHSNPVSMVNAQLWTIPIELECYLLLTALALLGFHRRRWAMLFIFVGFLALLEGRVLLGLTEPRDGRLLLLCFLAGVVAYQFRDRLRWSPTLLLLSIIFAFVFIKHRDFSYLCCLPITYIVIYLGLLNPKKSKFLESGDYSYGLFLYGFPLQQAVVAVVPAAREWYWNAALAIPLALLFSIMSWHLVEKRVLAKKQLLFSAHEWCASLLTRARRSLVAKQR
jgi:peptidoglycan/LPS O-acetylase OafA/YrhL